MVGQLKPFHPKQDHFRTSLGVNVSTWGLGEGPGRSSPAGCSARRAAGGGSVKALHALEKAPSAEGPRFPPREGGGGHPGDLNNEISREICPVGSKKSKF